MSALEDTRLNNAISFLFFFQLTKVNFPVQLELKRGVLATKKKEKRREEKHVQKEEMVNESFLDDDMKRMGREPTRRVQP